MHAIICGDGPMGRCAADELREAGHEVQLLGRPIGERHPPRALGRADVVVDFSVSAAVARNAASAVDGGCRRLVIGTTGWAHDAQSVERLLSTRRAAAVVAPTFSPAATLLFDLAGQLGATLGRLGGYDPYVVEWHRAGKRDRPSGTALELARRLIEAHPAKRRFARSDGGPADPESLEVVSLRAGSAPGTHLVGFDAPGETLEVRLTARDRRSYAAGARLAAEWLLGAERPAGIHTFTSVVRDLLATDALHPERTAS
jgi:4-hydroxy-tetrahydrodipicolinate reductase